MMTQLALQNVTQGIICYLLWEYGPYVAHENEMNRAVVVTLSGFVSQPIFHSVFGMGHKLLPSLF